MQNYNILFNLPINIYSIILAFNPDLINCLYPELYWYNEAYEYCCPSCKLKYRSWTYIRQLCKKNKIIYKYPKLLNTFCSKKCEIEYMLKQGAVRFSNIILCSDNISPILLDIRKNHKKDINIYLDDDYNYANYLLTTNKKYCNTNEKRIPVKQLKKMLKDQDRDVAYLIILIYNDIKPIQ